MEESIVVALENASKRNRYVNAGAVSAMPRLAEDAGNGVGALWLQPGNGFCGFHAALFPEPADV